MVSVSKKVIPRHVLGTETEKINPPLGVDLYLFVVERERRAAPSSAGRAEERKVLLIRLKFYEEAS